jgi:hypothetical protein
MVIWFLSLLLFICCITFMNLHMLTHPCIPGLKLTWWQCMIFLMCCWIWLPVFYWGFFHLYVLTTHTLQAEVTLPSAAVNTSILFNL